MKGIIMAGGEGTRLRPLTCDLPKPMISLMHRPVMAYALGLLKRHGITDVAVTLGYRPEAIRDAFGDGGHRGMKLTYYVERTPLGTAGGVRQARDMLTETFIVLSGDGVTDLDIARAAAFHRERGALATLVLRHAENPMDYGVVSADPEGRVMRFHEKPDWADVVSDTVNTGIYILEPEALDRVPEGRPCDFGHELFPQMVKDGLPVYGYVTRDYWCDVGDVHAYLAAHIDAMEGRIRLDDLFPLPGKAVQMPGAQVDRSAVLEGPCFIDAGAKVCAGAYIGPYSVIGAGCVVGERASVKRGILWPGAKLEARAQARGCVLAAGAVLGEGAQAYEEAVLGAGAVAGPDSVILPGVKLWPNRRAAEGERVDANRVWGDHDAEAQPDALSAASPAEAARATQACLAGLRPREALIGHAGGPMPEALWHAAAAGAMAQGVQVLNVGACTLPLLRHALRDARADAALFLDGRALTPLSPTGAPLDRGTRRSVAALNLRQDYPCPALDAAPTVLEMRCAEAAYVADAAARYVADPAGAAPIVFYSANPVALDLAERALCRAGLAFRTVGQEPDLLPAPGEIGLLLSPTGEACGLSDEFGALTEAEQQLLTCWVALEDGAKALPLPVQFTRGAEALAERYGATSERMAGERGAWARRLAEDFPAQFEWHFDGLLLALTALSRLQSRGLTLNDWRQILPPVYRRTRAVSVPPKQNGRILRDFAESQPLARVGGGVTFERDGGWAWVGAEDRPGRLRVVTEGVSAEFARELCDFCEGEIRRVCAEGEGGEIRNAEFGMRN